MKRFSTKSVVLGNIFAALLFFLSFSTAHAQWVHTYGGMGYDYSHSIQQTADGGYIVAGCTESFGAGDRDF